MHDLVIRQGTVIDGTGRDRRQADVGVDGGAITAIGHDIEPGRREIDAAGMIVTPGFVDIHTHYDGQATWDSQLAPSSLHGVTTAVIGNCGVGFAPVKSGTSDFLINLMEGIEDIPGTVLAEGVRFNWESFPEYLTALEAVPHAIDIGTQVPHTALRFYVMGERGAVHDEIPTESEIGRMGELLEEALNAGALGFTTSRTTKHRAKDGRLVPSLSAREPELAGLALAMKRAGRGVLEVNSDFGPGEFEAMEEAAAIAERPLSCLIVQVRQHPRLWRQTVDWIHDMRAKGMEATAQVASRGIGVMMALETTLHPFAGHPAWLEMANLSPGERYARLKEDGDLRRRLIQERCDDPVSRRVEEMLPRTFRFGSDLNYEPDPTDNVVAAAAAAGKNVWDYTLELMMADGGKGMLMHPFENYADGSLDTVREMLTDEASVMGVADGGAHVGLICDASQPTFMLSYWGRDRKRGRLPLEFLVRKQTLDTAACYGLTDRGVLAAGKKADINVIDPERINLRPPEVIYDLPTGGKEP
jgi:N-acyl-D-aspartate/D-glutamate deacylase